MAGSEALHVTFSDFAVTWVSTNTALSYYHMDGEDFLRGNAFWNQ